MVTLISVLMNCEFRVLYYFLHRICSFRRCQRPLPLCFCMFWYAFIFKFYLSITFNNTLFFRHFKKRHFQKRHLLSLLTLNVAVLSSGSKTLASHRYTRSELLSLRSHRLKNRYDISAIKRFGICPHRFRRRTHRGRRKQH